MATIRLKTKTYTLYEKGYSINQVSLILVRKGIKEPRLLSQASESWEIRKHYLKPLFLEAGYRGEGNWYRSFFEILNAH